jgi:hypothetical protein
MKRRRGTSPPMMVQRLAVGFTDLGWDANRATLAAVVKQELKKPGVGQNGRTLYNGCCRLSVTAIGSWKPCLT